jgi:ectoine hydroxylase-related dioxygenase (phytanoyl-CoA dioxygenase family)
MKETVLNLVSLLWQDFINFTHLFDTHSKDPAIRMHSMRLRKDGILVIENYLDAATCDALRMDIEQLGAAHPKTETLENGTRFNHRNQEDESAADHGMLDIFYIENTLAEVAAIDQQPLVKILESACRQEVVRLRSNAYVNKGVKNTRAFHIDNTQPVIYKAFIYLTDVPDAAHGAYAFVKKSHRFSPYIYWNIFRNLFVKSNQSTDIPIYHKRNVVVCTGKRGTLILSNQNAIHRGMAQEAGKKRVALVFNFMIRSRMSYLHASARANLSKTQVPTM